MSAGTDDVDVVERPHAVPDVAVLATGHAVVEPRRRRPKAGNVVLAAIGIVLVGLAVFGPLLPLPDPGKQALRDRLLPPVGFGGSWSRPLGTDALGRDMLSRLVSGTRLTVLIALTAVVFGAALGSVLGVIAGFKRGVVDAVISRITEAQLALPVILLAIAVVTSRGRSISTLILVLTLIGWTQYVRVIRAEALAIRERPFVLGLRAAGASDLRIVGRHVVPNIAGTIVALGTLEVGTMILAESALSFLGLGVVSPDISWGGLLSEGRENMRRAWWTVAIPGMAIMAVVLYVNLLGDALRTRYDHRKRTH